MACVFSKRSGNCLVKNESVLIKYGQSAEIADSKI